MGENSTHTHTHTHHTYIVYIYIGHSINNVNIFLGVSQKEGSVHISIFFQGLQLFGVFACPRRILVLPSFLNDTPRPLTLPGESVCFH